jgi:hypothetical protein
MQRFDGLNSRPGDSLVADSSAHSQPSLDDIGGELLAGSRFENEEAESDFASAGEES